MATVAVVVGAAAAVASAGAQAYSASSKGKGGSKISAPPGAGIQESQFSRGTRDILNEERSVVEEAVSQGRQITPEMYHALGVDPIYSGPDNSAEVSDLTGKSKDLHDSLDKITAKMAAIRASKGPGKAQALGQLERARKEAMRQITPVDDALGRAKTSGSRSIVGFQPYSPEGSLAGNLSLANKDLASALQGKLPTDPTLAHQYDVQEQQLREHLRRTLGPDYETSSAGQEALNNFARAKSEAFATYNRNVISQDTNVVGGLTGTQGETLRNLAFPSADAASLGQALGGAATSRSAEADRMQRERLGMGSLNQQRQEYNNALAQQQNNASAGFFQGVAGGLGGVSSALSGYSSPPPADNTYANAPGVSPVSAGIDRMKALAGSGQSPFTYGY